MEAARTSQVQIKEPKRGLDQASVGMLVFIGSEAVFFALLITAYLYFGAGANSGEAGRKALEPGVAAIFSVFLLSSSLTIWFADRSLAKKNQRGYILWMVATIVLGAIFLIGQGTEYLKLFDKEITMSRNQFGTTFFTLTGFHGLHVLAGLVMLSILTGLAIANKIRGPHSSGSNAISLYWHFVDVVWIVLYSVIYVGALLS